MREQRSFSVLLSPILPLYTSKFTFSSRLQVQDGGSAGGAGGSEYGSGVMDEGTAMMGLTSVSAHTSTTVTAHTTGSYLCPAAHDSITCWSSLTVMVFTVMRRTAGRTVGRIGD